MAATLCRLLLFASVYFLPSSCTPCRRETAPTDEDPCLHENMDFSGVIGVWQAAVHRIPSLVRYQNPPPTLLKRDCLANGTNYCFGDTVNYCTSCGTCCSDANSKWCCPSDGQCCGGSCCAGGNVCVNGQCFFLPPVTLTVTNTAYATVTHFTTYIDTVAHVVTSTSTVYSFTDVTITSQGATETDWKYVTETTVEKRSLQASPTGATISDCEEEDAVAGGILHSLRRACDVVLSAWESSTSLADRAVEEAPLLRRQAQATRPADAAPITTTVSALVTRTVDITNGVSRVISTDSTTILTTTIWQTRTRVRNAQATVQATSTLIYTSRRPVTSTTTRLASKPASLTNTNPPSNTSPAHPDPSDQPATLPTGTIIGIAIGSAAFAVLAALAIFFFCKWHRRRTVNRASMQGDAFLGTGGHNSYTATGPGYSHMFEPTKPRLAPLPAGHARTNSGITGSTAVAADSAASYTRGTPVDTPPVEAGGQEVHELGTTGPAAAVTTMTAPTTTEVMRAESWGPAAQSGTRRLSGAVGKGFYRDF